jgi:hypothetical protein
VLLALLLGCLRVWLNQFEISGNKGFTNLMILTHYDIDRRDGAVQYTRKNAVANSNDANTDSAICVSQWQNRVLCV